MRDRVGVRERSGVRLRPLCPLLGEVFQPPANGHLQLVDRPGFSRRQTGQAWNVDARRDKLAVFGRPEYAVRVRRYSRDRFLLLRPAIGSFEQRAVNGHSHKIPTWAKHPRAFADERSFPKRTPAHQRDSGGPLPWCDLGNGHRAADTMRRTTCLSSESAPEDETRCRSACRSPSRGILGARRHTVQGTRCQA